VGVAIHTNRLIALQMISWFSFVFLHLPTIYGRFRLECESSGLDFNFGEAAALVL